MYNFNNFTNVDFSWLVKNKYGTSGDDVMTSSLLSLYIEKYYGYGGNDTFMSSGGSDTYYGGSGVDTVNYSGSQHSVTVNLSTGRGEGGDAANDRYNSIENVRGSNFDDTLFGNNSNNVLKGGLGDDELFGRNGNDRLYGEDNHDDLYGGSGNDQLYGGNGFDKLYGGADNDTLYGGADSDGLYGDDGNDRLHGEEGSDSLYGGIGNDRLYGGNGDDNFEIEQGRDTYVGGSGHDSLFIRDSDNITINLQTGRGFGGDAEGDTYLSIERIFVNGGENITIQGSQADEEFYIFDHGNGAEDVELNAGGGNDLVFMEAQISDYFDKLEDSTIDGGEGIDTITAHGEGGVAVVIDLENDRYYAAGNRNDWIEINNFENAEGGWNNDTLIDDNNSNNTLTGNFGNDTFVFDHDGDSDTEADIITDFSSGEDRIDLDDTEINSWADLLDISDGDGMFNQGGGVLIRTADNNSGQFDTVLLEDVTVSELNENDFIF